MFQRTDLSFGTDDSGRFLPWLIAFMVFLVTLSIMGIFVVNGITDKFSRTVDSTLTLQIPLTGDPSNDQTRKKTVLKLLKMHSEIKSFSLIEPKNVRQLLRPWLGDAVNSSLLPLPVVIDVQIKRSGGFGTSNLKKVLLEAIPDISLDDHRDWLKNFLTSLKTLEFSALAIVILIGLANVGTVIFATRTSLGLQSDNISILHFIGAHDKYIAKQFAFRASWLGIKGGLIGLVISVPFALGLKFGLENMSSGLLPEIVLSPFGWICVGLIVPTIAFLAMVTAYSTVLNSLSDIL
ncbi:MAG: FtsX-like permease family protein [Pseudomonadota bacterium]|nr:FtsX-like permease family protein [Pseudomonadota bacterium]